MTNTVDTPPAAPDITEPGHLWGRRHALKLRALTNRIYQQDRGHIFERREGMVKAASLVAGSAALSRLVDATTITYCVAIIFCGTAASLVFGWGGKARDAARRASDWATLERDIESAGERDFSEAQLNTWAARANELEANEPAMHPALFERAYLRACLALDCKPTTQASLWTRYAPAIRVP